MVARRRAETLPTVRIGVFSDVHGDLHALQDALEQMRRMGCATLLCAGDIVDYGLFGDETIALLAKSGVTTIRGNHDRWAVSDPDMAGAPLKRRSLAFLRQLPMSWAETIAGVRVAMHHASPGSDMRMIPFHTDPKVASEWLYDAKADVLIVGHSHHRMCVRSVEGGVIVNPGALLRDPADGFRADLSAPGTFGVLELPAKHFRVFRARDGAESPFDLTN